MRNACWLFQIWSLTKVSSSYNFSASCCLCSTASTGRPAIRQVKCSQEAVQGPRVLSTACGSFSISSCCSCSEHQCSLHRQGMQHTSGRMLQLHSTSNGNFITSSTQHVCAKPRHERRSALTSDRETCTRPDQIVGAGQQTCAAPHCGA